MRTVIAKTVLVGCGVVAMECAAMDPWDDPRFAHDGRFPAPAVEGMPLIPAALATGGAEWRYVTSTPSGNWHEESYDDSSWFLGNAGFGSFCCVDPLDNIGVSWTSGDLWMRTTFHLDDPSADWALWGRWDDSIEVYINGVLAFETEDWSPLYRYAPISPAAKQALRVGSNTIAARVADIGGARYADLGLALNPMIDAPWTGFYVNPALAPIHDQAAAFLTDQIIPAGAVVVMKGEDIVLSAAYGHADKTQTTPLTRDAIFRLASLDKPPTAAVARHLADQGFVDSVTGQVITLDTPVFPLLVARGLTPFVGMTLDPRVNDVTFRHLIEHRSGLADLVGLQEALALAGTTAEAFTPWDHTRRVYGSPLVFDPGTDEAYCNACYGVLRHLVDELTGGVDAYITDVLMEDLGGSGVRLVREALSERWPEEPWYATGELPWSRKVFLDDQQTLGASAETFARFCRGYNLWSGHALENPVTGMWAPVPDNGATWFGGAFPGTRTFAIQRRWDEVTIVVLSNANTDVGLLAVWINDFVDTLPPAAFEPTCPADVTFAGACMHGVPDGQVDLSDFACYIAGWSMSLPSADVTAAGACVFGSGGDGVDLSDFSCYLSEWAQGCP